MNKLTKHQTNFIEYVIKDHYGYGMSLELKAIIDRKEYTDKEKETTLPELVRIHKAFLRGITDIQTSYGNLTLEIYGKPTKYLK